MLSCSCTLFNQKETFQLQNYTVTCCQSRYVAEKKLHLAISGRKYDPGKKALKRKLTTDVKTADPQPSTSKDESASTQPTQAETIPEQQAKDAPISEQQQEGETGSTQQAKTIPLLHCNCKTNPFLNNDNNTLLIHLHLAKTVPIHFQIIAKTSNCLQQKIPVPYQRNRYTVYIQNLIRFNQLCLIFHYRSLKKYMSHILRNFCQNFRFSVIYSLKCLLLSRFSTNQTHLSYFFFFSSHFLFHTNLNLVHVLVLVSSSHSSSIILSLFHTNLNLVHVLVLVSSSHSSSIILSLFHTNLNLVHVLILVSSFRSSSIVLTVHFFLRIKITF